jgi:hypothetical protein
VSSVNIRFLFSYEIQLVKKVRRKGLGKFLMNVCDVLVV